MIKRELTIFLIVGASTVLVDFICYRGLIEFQVMEVDMARATGFLVGTLFAFCKSLLGIWPQATRPGQCVAIFSLVRKHAWRQRSNQRTRTKTACGCGGCFSISVSARNRSFCVP